jgi:hypothetical protein
MNAPAANSADTIARIEVMSTHTPGPWHVAPGDDRYVFSPHNAAPVASCSSKANAALIAEAPNMLAVLKELPDIIKDFDGGNPETETGWASEEMLDLWMRVNAVIAKAEGTS